MSQTITIAHSEAQSITHVEGNTHCIVSSDSATVQSITPVVVGAKGDKGTGADDLEPRIAALEAATDGMVDGTDFLAHYILNKS